MFFIRSCHGVGDRPLSCKPGIAGSILGFFIKPLSVEPSDAPVIKYKTQTINLPRPVLVTTHGKATQKNKLKKGAQWLSGRVFDSRLRGRGFEPHRCHCVVSLSKNINPNLILVQPRKTHPFITERLLMGRKESD